MNARRNLWCVHTNRIAVHDLTVRQRGQGVRMRLGGSSLALLSCARSLLASCILLCETLLPSLGFPVVIADAPPVGDDSAAKLAEHGPCGDNGDLS